MEYIITGKRTVRKGKHAKRGVLLIDGVEKEAKDCSRCQKMKELSAYGVEKRTKDGRVSMCLKCKRGENKERRKDPKVREYHKQYSKENRERFNKSNRAYYRRNTKKLNDKTIRWMRDNPDKYRKTSIATQNRRRARKRDLLTDYDGADKLMNSKLYGGCALTGAMEGLHEDHFVSLSTGHCGTYAGNMIPLEASLNMSKGSKNPFEWIKDNIEKLDKDRVMRTITLLSYLNGVSLSNYIEFVYWCYENPRKTDEVTDENRDSLKYWMGLKGRKYLEIEEVG